MVLQRKLEASYPASGSFEAEVSESLLVLEALGIEGDDSPIAQELSSMPDNNLRWIVSSAGSGKKNDESVQCSLTLHLPTYFPNGFTKQLGI